MRPTRTERSQECGGAAHQSGDERGFAADMYVKRTLAFTHCDTLCVIALVPRCKLRLRLREGEGEGEREGNVFFVHGSVCVCCVVVSRSARVCTPSVYVCPVRERKSGGHARSSSRRQRLNAHFRSPREAYVPSFSPRLSSHLRCRTRVLRLYLSPLVPLFCLSLLKSSTGSSVRLFGESQPCGLKNIPDAATPL